MSSVRSPVSFLVPSARAQKAFIDFDKEADFSRIHSYQWRTHPVFEKLPELKEKYGTAIQLILGTGNADIVGLCHT